MINSTKFGTPGLALTPEQLADLGGGAVAYVKPMKGAEIQKLFPQVGAVQPNMTLYALLAADGSPLLLTDSRDAALANAWEHNLQPVSVH